MSQHSLISYLAQHADFFTQNIDGAEAYLLGNAAVSFKGHWGVAWNEEEGPGSKSEQNAVIQLMMDHDSGLVAITEADSDSFDLDAVRQACANAVGWDYREDFDHVYEIVHEIYEPDFVLTHIDDAGYVSQVDGLFAIVNYGDNWAVVWNVEDANVPESWEDVLRWSQTNSGDKGAEVFTDPYTAEDQAHAYAENVLVTAICGSQDDTGYGYCERCGLSLEEEAGYVSCPLYSVPQLNGSDDHSSFSQDKE